MMFALLMIDAIQNLKIPVKFSAYPRVDFDFEYLGDVDEKHALLTHRRAHS